MFNHNLPCAIDDPPNNPAKKGSLKSFTNQKERQLMMPSSKVIQDSTVLASAEPQVNAPNLTLTNNPTATQNTYNYPRMQYPHGSPMNTPQMTIVPPKEVSPDAYQNAQDSSRVFKANRKLVETPGLKVMAPNFSPPRIGGNPQGQIDINAITKQIIGNLKKKNKNIEIFDPAHPKKRRKRHNRRLFGNGFFNAGPGFVDVGSMPMGSVNLAAANPNLSSMGPFIPQANAPSPIRIKIKDPWTPKKKKKLLSQGQKMMNRVLMDNAVGEVAKNLAFFSDSISNFKGTFNEKIKIMNNVILETKQKIQKENAAAQSVPEMMREKMGLD